MEPLLFSPLSIRGLTLRNRIVLSPMLTPYAQLPPVYGHYLGRRQRSYAPLRNSTWQKGMGDEPV